MSNDLISREALKEEVSKLILNWNDKTEYGQARISSYEFVLELIDNAPTVPNEYMRGYEAAEREYKRPQGEWQPDMDSFYCDQCGVTALEINRKWYKSNFCPNCGADMQKGGAE